MKIKIPKTFDLNIKNSESISKLAKAAQNGGVYAALMIPEHKPIFDKLHLSYNLKRANETNFKLFVAVEGIHNNTLSDISILKQKGASAIYINSDEDMNLIKRIFEYAEFLNIPVFVNANNKALSIGVMNDSPTAYSLGLAGIPQYSESIEVAKILELAKNFDVKTVFLNITTKESIEILKTRPSNIFIDVCIDNLHFCDEDIKGFNTLLKTFPPLRSKEDRQALLKACENETIDFISSNHIAAKEKDLPFEETEPGISKLDIFTQLAYSLPLPIKTITKLTSTNPAKLFNINIDEYIEIEFKEYKIDPSKFSSSAKKTPYKNLKVKIV